LTAIVMPIALYARGAWADEDATVTVRGSSSSGFTSRARLDDAKREVTDAASLVEPLPGVHVRRLGGDDGFATLSIRGSGANQVNVLLAGVPMTGGGDPSLDLSTLPLWPGATAKVYRSFAPASLGPGSLGGALALDPPSPTAIPGTEAWAAAGSHGAARLRVGDVRPLDWGGEARIVTGVTASRADDDFTYFDPHTRRMVPRRNNGHAQASALVSVARPVRWSPRGAEGTARMTTIVQARRQDLPGTVDQPTPYDRLDSSRLLEVLELTFPVRAGAIVARAWGRRDTLDLSTYDRVAGRARDDQTIVAAGGAAGLHGRPRDDVTIDVRLDGSGERFDPKTAGTGLGATRSSVGLGADAEWRALPSLTWSASGRADAWHDDAVTGGSTEARPTGHAGVEVTRGPFAIAAHGGAVSRPASFVERFGDQGTFLSNRDLRTESAWIADAGARVQGRRGALRGRAELVGFAVWATDLITFVAQGAYGRLRATNIGRARVLGLEAIAEGAWGPADLRVVYTGLATTNESSCDVTLGACDRPPLPGRPEADLVADAGVAIGPARVRYGVDAVSGLRADLSGAVVVPSRVLHFAGVRVDVPRVPGLRVAADVRNLFDLRTGSYDGALGPVERPIGDAYDYPLPGRTVLVSARYRVP